MTTVDDLIAKINEKLDETKTVCVSCAPPKGVRPQSEIWPCATVLVLAEAYGIEP